MVKINLGFKGLICTVTNLPCNGAVSSKNAFKGGPFQIENNTRKLTLLLISIQV